MSFAYACVITYCLLISCISFSQISKGGLLQYITEHELSERNYNGVILASNTLK